MKKLLTAVLCVLALAFSVSAYDIQTWNIGTSEDASHLSEGHDWSNQWTWGGGYGGGDDGTFRLLMGPGDGCTNDDRSAYFSMDAGSYLADTITLRHLDGSQGDGFNVYVKDGANWTLIGTYVAQDTTPTELWFTDSYNFTPRSGVIEFRLEATDTVTAWCTGWGQVAFSWARIEGEGTQIPEFSAVAAGLALAGAATGFILLRRKK